MSMMDKAKPGFRAAAVAACLVSVTTLGGCATIATDLGVSPADQGYDANGVKTTIILPGSGYDDTLVRFKMVAPKGEADVIMVASIRGNQVTVMGTNSNDKYGRGYFNVDQDKKTGQLTATNRGYVESQDGFGTLRIATNGPFANPTTPNQAQANTSIAAMRNVALTAVTLASAKRDAMVKGGAPSDTHYEVICASPRNAFSSIVPGEYWNRSATVAEWGPDGYLRYEINGKTARVSTDKVDVTAFGNYSQAPLISLSGNSNPMSTVTGELNINQRGTGTGMHWRGNSLVSRTTQWSPGVTEHETAVREMDPEVAFWRGKIGGAADAVRSVGKCNYLFNNTSPFTKFTP